MIERLYLKELLAFKEVELEFEKGLVVITGPSGAGKSVLISAIFSSFGYGVGESASLCEMNLIRPNKLLSDTFELENNMTIKTLKKEKLRYLIDGQNISRKALNHIFSPYVQYLSVRDKGGFESSSLLDLIDNQLTSKDKNYKKLLKEYLKRYDNYIVKLAELNKIKNDEAKLVELIEYARYEVDKITRIDPKIGEEIELIKVKQQLSHIDKIKDALSRATDIFTLESSVEEVYKLLDKDGSQFFDTMNQLRADFEETEMLANDLEDLDIEDILNRLSDITSLQNRYGSIEETLKYKELKEKELLGYKNIEQDKSMLISFLDIELAELNILTLKISKSRKKEAKFIEKDLDKFLVSLKLPSLKFIFTTKNIYKNGIDSVDILLGESNASTLSGGEFNRVRLALMASTMASNKDDKGVLILDEIDANVSGDESIAIADMISQLSRVYQVFAISHQPHLSAKANQHILVDKLKKYSQAKVLNDEDRVLEISRIIAGENPTMEAIEFAKRLRS